MTEPFDPADPAFLADPYPTFAALRAVGPVHHHAGLGLHLAVSHAACDRVLRDRSLGRVWVDREPAEAFPAFNLLHRTSMLESEPPTHSRLRRLVAGAFARGHVERLRPQVDRLADELVADLVAVVADDGDADLLERVAQPLPVEVIARLLGVPPPDRHLLRPWSNAIVKMYEYGLPEQGRRDAEAAARAFVDYLRELVGERRRHPRPEDLVSDLVAAADGPVADDPVDEGRVDDGRGDDGRAGSEGRRAAGGRLGLDEIVGTCVLLLMAGHEATVNTVGNGLLGLLGDRRAWAAVVADPALVAPAAEEMVRHDAPLQLFERTAARDVEVLGTVVPAGGKVAALLGAAARDPAVFAEPDRFVPGRTPNPHLGFGAGIHFCLGAPLARIEVQSVVAALRTRAPGLHVVGRPQRRPEFVLRGLRELRVAT